MILNQVFAKRYARFRWVALFPAALAILFAGLARDDGDILTAAPFLAVAGLSVLYIIRPMYVLWAMPFAGFAAFTLIATVAPFVGLGSDRPTDWPVSIAVGAVPTALLWPARPRALA